MRNQLGRIIGGIALLVTLGSTAEGQRAGRDTATVPLELVAALLGGFGTDHPPELRVGALAPPLPAELTPAGARVLGSMVYARDGNMRGGTPSAAIFVMSQFPEDAVAAYGAHLERTGWRPAVSIGMPRGGFTNAAATVRASAYCRDSAWVNFNASSRNAGGSHLRVNYSTVQANALSPCSDRRPTQTTSYEEIPLPDLRPPTGAMSLGANSGGGSNDRRESGVRLDVQMSAAAVVKHYADQMRADGWTAAAPVTNGGTASQVFEKKDAQGRQLRALLVAIEVPGGLLLGERDVSIRVVRSTTR